MKLWGVGMAGPPGTRSNLGDARSSVKWVEVPAKLRGSSSKLTVACETHVGFGLAFDQARTNVLWTCVITVGVVLIVFDWIDSFLFSMANFSGMNMQPHYGIGGVSPQRCGFISCNLWRSMFVLVSLYVERVMTLVCAIRQMKHCMEIMKMEPMPPGIVCFWIRRLRSMGGLPPNFLG